MKYNLYSGLECDQFKPLLTVARIIGTLSIIGFYLTLMLAAYNYFSFTSTSILETASSVANGILINGFVICVLGFGVSVCIAWFIAARQNKTSEFVGQTL